jgi:hypothetical protein
MSFGKKPKMKKPPPAPTQSMEDQALSEGQRREEERLLRMKGRRATLFTNPRMMGGVGSSPKSLLGE